MYGEAYVVSQWLFDVEVFFLGGGADSYVVEYC
jgi:hypothetical protein